MGRRTPTLAATSVYVHVPFCVVKCGYCDFNSYTVEDESALDRFLDGLHGELKLVSLPDTPTSVFFGVSSNSVASSITPSRFPPHRSTAPSATAA